MVYKSKIGGISYFPLIIFGMMIDSVVISPKDKVGFIASLKAINSKIEIN